METGKSNRQETLAKLFAKLRPTEEELAKLKAVEEDPIAFAHMVGEIDRKYKVRSLETLRSDKKLFNAQASYPVNINETRANPLPIQSGFGIIGQLAASNQLACDCLVPFKFTGLIAYNAMSGPNQFEVARGMLGALRLGADEYQVFNPGDTTGKTRVHFFGQLCITFAAQIPQAGRWCLIHPSGILRIRGHSRVVGHGNMTTSYDAKVWFDYYQFLYIGFTAIEESGGDIHYNGTRSGDHKEYFCADRFLPPRYIFFDVPDAGELLELMMLIEVDAAANKDGLALGVIDQFGFLANYTDEYDTFVVKAL
ncbi:MAG: hypothetical protein AB1894_27670 [Chloroflexota bacterium]